MHTTAKLISTLAAVTLLTSVGGVYAQQEPQGPYPGYGMGPEMMHGWGGPRTMWGNQDGWQMGRGMMGPGMMYGQGPMMGPGMMYGYGPGAMLNLNESQQKKIGEIHEELRKRHWDTMGKMNDEYVKLRELYGAEKRDPDAIGKQWQKIYDLRRQMMVESVKAQNRMEEQLTEEQKKQWRNSYGPGWMPQ